METEVGLSNYYDCTFKPTGAQNLVLDARIWVISFT